MQLYTSAEVETMHRDFAALRKSLRRMIAMHESMMKEIDHKSSCYTADTIREMNEAPLEAERLLKPTP